MQEVTITEPRDENEMIELFEDLLFMRTEEFLGHEADKKDIGISSKDIELLGTLGITDRIFRRWYQTTWHYHDFAPKHFSGMTPRQELSIRYPSLATGHAYLSTELVKMNTGSKVLPHFLTPNIMESIGSIFSYGKNELSQQKASAGETILVPPSYDVSFKEFVSRMEEIEQDIKKYKITTLPEDSEKRYWQIFWQDVPLTLALNSELDIKQKKLIELSVPLRFLFEAFAKRQGENSGDFLSFDELFYNVWQICQDFDPKLISLEKLLFRNDSDISGILELKNGQYSFSVYYNLTNILDELFLFPADRYFGAIECVWTDKESFLRDLMMTITLLKNNLKIPSSEKNYDPKFPNLNIEEKTTDIYRLWFSPPTAFRILPRALEFME